MSNLSKFVVIIWVFLVLVISSNYTASLSIDKLKRNGDYVGYLPGTVVDRLLKSLNFEQSKIKAAAYEDWNKELSKGSRHGIVSPIFDKVIHIKSFLRQYCDKNIMVGPTYRVGIGYGFVFPKGSLLVPYISQAISSVTEAGKIVEAEKQWFGSHTICAERTSDSLTVANFQGIFIISGLASVSALLLHLVFSHKHAKFLLTCGKQAWERLLSKLQNRRLRLSCCQ